MTEQENSNLLITGPFSSGVLTHGRQFSKRAAAIEQMGRAGIPELKIADWVMEHDAYMFSIDKPSRLGP